MDANLLSVLQPLKSFQTLNIRQHKAAVPEREGTNEVSPRIASFHPGRVSDPAQGKGITASSLSSGGRPWSLSSQHSWSYRAETWREESPERRGSFKGPQGSPQASTWAALLREETAQVQGRTIPKESRKSFPKFTQACYLFHA